MNRDPKYIVYPFGHHELLVMFPDIIEHREMAEFIGVKPDDVISAGFIAMNGTCLGECYGQSMSLKKMSRESYDTMLLRRWYGVMEEED